MERFMALPPARAGRFRMQCKPNAPDLRDFKAHTPCASRTSPPFLLSSLY